MDQSLASVMRNINDALRLDNAGNEKEAYQKYLDCILCITCNLQQSVRDTGGDVVISKEVTKQVKLAQQCVDRVSILVEQIGSSQRPMVLQSPSDEVRPIAKAKPFAAVPPLQSLESMANTFTRTQDKSPMELAYRRNQQLMAAYRARMARMNKGDRGAFNLSLTLQRKMEENLAIAKKTEMALAKKMQERQERLEEHAARRFTAPMGMSKEEQEQRQIYKKILEYEQDAKWLQNWRLKLESSPQEPEIICQLVQEILRCRDHPLTLLVKEYQTRVYEKIYPIITDKKDRLDAIRVPLDPSLWPPDLEVKDICKLDWFGEKGSEETNEDETSEKTSDKETAGRGHASDRVGKTGGGKDGGSGRFSKSGKGIMNENRMNSSSLSATFHHPLDDDYVEVSVSTWSGKDDVGTGDEVGTGDNVGSDVGIDDVGTGDDVGTRNVVGTGDNDGTGDDVDTDDPSISSAKAVDPASDDQDKHTDSSRQPEKSAEPSASAETDKGGDFGEDSDVNSLQESGETVNEKSTEEGGEGGNSENLQDQKEEGLAEKDGQNHAETDAALSSGTKETAGSSVGEEGESEADTQNENEEKTGPQSSGGKAENGTSAADRDSTSVIRFAEDTKADLAAAITKGEHLQARLSEEQAKAARVLRLVSEDIEKYSAENMDDLFDDDEEDDEEDANASAFRTRVESSRSESGTGFQNPNHPSSSNNNTSVGDPNLTSISTSRTSSMVSTSTNDASSQGGPDSLVSRSGSESSMQEFATPVQDPERAAELAQLSQEAYARHVKNTAADVHMYMDKLLVLFTIAYEQLDCPLGRDQCYASLEETFFKPLWKYLLMLFRLSHYKEEIAVACKMTQKADITPREIGVTQKLCLQPVEGGEGAKPYQSAITQLSCIKDHYTMLSKLECIVKTVRLVPDCVKDFYTSKGCNPKDIPSIGADDLLPVISYVVMKSRLPQLVSECHAMAEFIHEGYIMGQEGYCLTTLETAVSYLVSSDLDCPCSP